MQQAAPFQFVFHHIVQLPHAALIRVIFSKVLPAELEGDRQPRSMFWVKIESILFLLHTPIDRLKRHNQDVLWVDFYVAGESYEEIIDGAHGLCIAPGRESESAPAESSSIAVRNLLRALANYYRS